MPSSAPRASSSVAAARSTSTSRAGTPGTPSGPKHPGEAAKDDPDVTMDEGNSSIARVAAQSRHEADLAQHAYEPPRPERVQDDWQVAYVWAFIIKFGLQSRIGSLLCLEDLERSLCEPVANRPDDVLESVLIAFLKNLKPGLRNLDCTNIQSSLSNYISDMLLTSSEFTVWDRPWAPHEEARGDCCNKSADRTLLGRLRGPNEEKNERVKKNPIAQIEKKGGGIFELEWYERARLLRQLVDWQLSHSDVIREKVKDAQAKKDEANKKKPKRKNPEPEEEEKVDKSAEIWIEPIGLDRNKNRIWSLDKSARLYKSGNPFKRPCPLVTMTTTRAELESQMEEFKAHGGAVIPKPSGSGPKGKPTQKETLAYRRKLKGVEDEKLLGEWIEEFLPGVEKEEMRIMRARKKSLENKRMLQAFEARPTRTRRPTRKVDYTDPVDDYDDERPRRGGRRAAASAAYEPPRKPGIPGERRSGRLQARVEAEEEEDEGPASVAPSRDMSAAPSSPAPPEVFPPGTKKTRGYAYVAVGSPPPHVNGNGMPNGRANGGGTADEPMIVDDE